MDGSLCPRNESGTDRLVGIQCAKARMTRRCRAHNGVERAVRTAEAIAAREAAMEDALRAGRWISEVMGADYEHMLKC